MINRPNYIEAINPFIDQPLVKILAGIRRCGKSTIFEMLEEELLRRGVPADHIICKRYTEMDIPENITAKQMYDELVEAIAGKGHCYLLLDEIQEINGWEKAVNSLLEGSDADIYVTGSNSKLMSSEISTTTGRLDHLRTDFSTSMPSISGRPRSSTIRSGQWEEIMVSASSPLRTTMVS